MSIVLTCDCGRKLQIADQFAGQQGQCPACKRTLQIPFVDSLPLADEPEPYRPLSSPAVPTMEPEIVEDVPEVVEEIEADAPIGNHGGESLRPDAEFFIDPPPEIGRLISAQTTLLRRMAPMPLSIRFAIASVAALVCVIIGVVIVLLLQVRTPFWFVFWPVILGAAGYFVGVLATHFVHACTYVGSEGIARFVCAGSRDNLRTKEIFLFRDATDLRTSTTLHYTNGVYQHTAYSFIWSDVGGRQRHKFNGLHNNQNGTPPASDIYHFGRSAEIAWTNYLFPQTMRQIELSGTATFNLRGNRWIKIGNGFLILGLTREPIEIDGRDLAGAKIEQGIVRLRRADAKEGWFSSTGVYRFTYDDLANANLFFFMLEKIVGVPVS